MIFFSLVFRDTACEAGHLRLVRIFMFCSLLLFPNGMCQRPTMPCMFSLKEEFFWQFGCPGAVPLQL